ncbi:hypothetical protein FKP32DRAFT_721552 [Trametes sanguinea]|nr:hypothetical protein FKP32DRAFT_721552 [Trametes sanguinea]
MPCNWSTTASLLLRSVQLKTSSHVQTRSIHCLSQLTRPAGHCTIPRDTLLSRLRGFRGLATVATASAPPPGPPPSNGTADADIQAKSANLSHAQVSRAAAQAVRLCIKDRQFGDALYVVNSACHSVLQGPLQSSDQPKSQLEPIQFGQPVSPRLSAHAFLHGLIRGGYQKKASTYAALMIRAGIPIRTKTMESIISTTFSNMLQFGPFAKVTHPQSRYDSPSVLHLRSSTVSNECTRAALDLVREARTFGQQRTERMYRSLIDTLLLQGEILVASLLFVLLVKDFEVRTARRAAQAQSDATENHITHETLRVSPPSRAALRRRLPLPDPSLMTPILDAIDSSAKGSIPPGPEMAQSLALFAMLLDTGQIGHGRVAGLISSLYEFPRIDTCVWIVRNGKPFRVVAYRYFHEVLKRLIDSLSKDNPSPLAGQPLSQRSYNSLLAYALRHRLSPEMASVVLHHMCEVRKPPCEPNVVTFNILLRSGTLLRRVDISDAALAAFRAASKDRKTQVLFDQLDRIRTESAVVATPSTCEQTPSSRVPAAPTSNAPGFAGTLHQLYDASFVVPDKVTKPDLGLTSDRYTFTSLVMHLTSTGHPDAVADALFQIMPELTLVDHPACGTASLAAVPPMNPSRAMKRAIKYGPHFYSCLINALTKAGEVGLAERVFILGQKAERASRQRRFSPRRPWRLTKHSYTALMQAYANVVRGRIPRHKLRESYLGTMLLNKRETRMERQEAYAVESGYARYVQMRDRHDRETRRVTKPQLCRRNARLLYRSLVSGGKTLFENLMRMSPEDMSRLRPRPRRDVYEVKPDERFFNAALKLFAPRPTARCTRHHSSAYYRRRWRRATNGRSWKESTPTKYSPMFRRVLRAIARRGFDVPLAYRHVLAGEEWFRVRERRKTYVRSPFAFPQPGRRPEKPWEIPVAKTRGLPVRRNTMKRLLMGKGPVAQLETSV